MNERVLHYIKTHHFADRQKERNITDLLLIKLLDKIKRSLKTKTNIIVSKATLHDLEDLITYDYKQDRFTNLILSIDRRVLVTLYFTDNLYFLFRNHPTRDFLII